MYLHNEIQLAVLPIMAKHNLTVLELVGLMCEAAAELCTLSEAGIAKRHAELLTLPLAPRRMK